MRKLSLIILGIVAIVAVLGLLLFFKTSATGQAYFYPDSPEKGYITPARAQNAPLERFYGGGITPEGIVSTRISRKGRQPYSDVLGYEPCPEGYAPTSIDSFKEGCIDVKYPRYYIGKKCCPISSY